MQETSEPTSQFESFAVRVWLERVGPGKTEWRGRIQHMLTGETHFFRDWTSLIDRLEGMLQLSQSIRR